MTAVHVAVEKNIKIVVNKSDLILEKKNQLTRWLISAGLGLFLAVFVWGVIEHFATDHPEMEPYTDCGNPNCNRIHYRPVSDNN